MPFTRRQVFMALGSSTALALIPKLQAASVQIVEFDSVHQVPLGFGNAPVCKFREKRLRILNLPTHISHRQQSVMIEGLRFVELVLEVLDALVKDMLLLNRPGPFHVKTGIRQRSRGLAESGDDDHG